MRPQRILLMLAILSGIAFAAPASAQPLPSISDQPGATLLLPYFEVDLANPAGSNTLFTINNASATAILTHVTIWSTMHVPVYVFNVYLTGYDVQTVYVRDLLNGVLPQTASAGQDPTDTISPHGQDSQDINFASCNGVLPPPATLPAATTAHLRASLTGASSPMNGLCASIPDGSMIARGYITVDTVSNCTSKLPSDAGYFAAGGTGDATDQNVLWGDYSITNHIGGLESSDGGPLVHIRASSTDPATSTSGRYTFYGRLVSWTAVDNREPLTTTWAVRYALPGGGYSTVANTSLTVWRDAKVSQSYFVCGGQPPWYPLGQEGIVIFDEQEHVMLPQTFPFSPQPPNTGLVPFPAGTQRVVVGGALLPVPFSAGWLYVDLNTTVAAAGPNPPVDPAAAQAWVAVHQKGVGRYSVGWPSIMMDTARAANHFVP